MRLGSRSFRTLGVVASLLIGGLGGLSATAARATATLPDDVTITMIDTGVRATHQEFDYQGPTSTTDQFVGWWDFSADAGSHVPAPGELWDTVFPDPYDNDGHGTATAGQAAGLNVPNDPIVKTPSFAPGTKLAVAKVDDAAAGISSTAIAEAIKWAREVVHTDIISMSIGVTVATPTLGYQAVYDEIELARQAGILVVVANGNTPGSPGFGTPYGNSPYVLGVGAKDRDGARVTTDPEVTAAFGQNLASNACDTCYAGEAGTSFGTPLVAGFAAHLLKTGLANGHAPTADYLETLVKYSARDTSMPPSIEGYGIIGATELPAAEAHAAAGTLPARPSPDLNALYVETVQGTLDQTWTTATRRPF